MYVVFMLSIAAFVGIDQFTKYLAITKLKPIKDYPIIENVLHLRYVENKGAAFGILQNKQTFFLVITVIVVIIASIYYGRLPKTKIYHWVRAALILLVSGAIGNIIDRVRLGYVVDFIYFKLINFAVFNFADMCVVIGVMILSGFTLFFEKGSKT